MVGTAGRTDGRGHGLRLVWRLGLVVAVTTLATGVVSRSAFAATAVGTPYVWMDDDAGQYCNGTISTSTSNVDSSKPVVSLLPPSSAVAAGHSHTLALDASGAVYACGYSSQGALGTGVAGNSYVPVRAALPPGVVATAVAAGWNDSLALTTTGAVYAWGLNTYGELGNGTTKDSRLPVQVHLPTGVVAVAIAAGQFHNLALTSTGAVYAWGYNGFGQLGDGTATQRSVPVRVHLPKGAIGAAIGCGDDHSLVATSAGPVYSFGKNTFGQLGDGTTVPSRLPVRVSLPAGVSVTALAAGGVSPTAKVPEGDYSVAVTSTGAVYAWGADAQGQLGNNSTTDSSVPVLALMPSGAVAVAVGAGSNFAHVLTTDGNVYFWGAGGTGGSRHLTPYPTTLPLGLHAVAVSAGPDGEQMAAVFVPNGP